MNPESVLLPHHLEQLTKESGIALEIIQARGYRSILGLAVTRSSRLEASTKSRADSRLGCWFQFWTLRASRQSTNFVQTTHV